MACSCDCRRRHSGSSAAYDGLARTNAATASLLLTLEGLATASSPATTEKSVIGNDLKIIGQGLKIIGRGVLQVDGEIEGDVQGAEVIVGEKGKVMGMVAAQEVIICGAVSGVVCGKTVALQASSHVEGDVHHKSLAIEQGALFEGRSRRAANESELNSVVEGKGAGQPTVQLKAVG